jgi:RNA polymerase sigma factor (sigma-70 family)
MMDLIQEGNIGLMQAVQRFDPYRGVKLSSYSAWWIRAYMLRFILNNWRLVKLGTTQAQRKLFFNLNKQKAKLAAMGIERDDKVKRQDWVLRGFRQFDAPVSIVVTYDRSIQGSDIAPFDCGGVVNCLVNAAWSRGLGCVINSQGIMQSPVVRAEAGIPDDQVIQTCVAMGWPDDSFPANAVVSERKSVDEAAVFRGFTD